MEHGEWGKEQHLLYAERIDGELERIDAHLERLDRSVEKITDLAISIEKLAQSVQTMADTQKTMDGKLTAIENRDGEMWRKVVGYIITSVISIIIGVVACKVGLSQ